MDSIYYVGLDIHKKVIAVCVKDAAGAIHQEATLEATRAALLAWAHSLGRPWVGAMEATLFTGWIYDFLKPLARELKVGHPLMLRAIAAAKKKSDRIDARKLCDLLRADLLPQCYMAPAPLRELRRMLRWRNLIVREGVRMQNKAAGLLMEVGAPYERRRLRGKRYFAALLDSLEETPASVVQLLRLTRSNVDLFASLQKTIKEQLREHPLLKERIERLMSIPGVGEIVALTWALEVCEPERFSSIAKAVSYCGLCAGQRSSGGKDYRGPISKQRNKHLQRVLVEAAKIAPRFDPELSALHERELKRGSRNRATLAVARRLVAWLLAVDRGGKPFERRSGARAA